MAMSLSKPIDHYFKFIQSAFNTESPNFKEILRVLGELAKVKQPNSNEAGNLYRRLNTMQILKDPNKYKKFDKLGNNFGLYQSNLRQVYKVSDEIIKDMTNARDWLESYEKFSRLTQITNLKGLHRELIQLGKSILGRAIELCPKDTGFLRSSGTLLDFGTYILIVFTAPYATYVHENMEIAHPNGGRAKFLELALQEFFPNRSVWTDIHGYNGVMCKISINPLLLEYRHYD